MTERLRCAIAASTAGEPCYATASTVRRWLLVEQPGPWGIDAVRESRMSLSASRGLQTLGRRLRARVLLIRRPAGRVGAGHQVFAAYTGVRDKWVESFAVASPDEVPDLTLDGLADGARVGGRPEPDPLLLVCTNGRHDPCCAEFGRPVATSLAARYGDAVWEVSHIGGDRFAGNMIVLPDGIYYGGLDAERALDVVASHHAGRVDLDTFRGRSAYPFVVQAAEYLLRREMGELALDAVRWTRRRQLADGRWRITFHTSSGLASVDLEVGRDDHARQLTCRADRVSRPPTYRLLRIAHRAEPLRSSATDARDASRR